MSNVETQSKLENALELGPSLAFFGIYLYMKDEVYTVFGTEYSGFIAATVVFIPILFASMAGLWFLKGRLSPLHIFTMIMVVFFGSLTIWFNSEAFFKFKTTLVYSFMALLLGIGLLRGKSFLQMVMNRFMPMEVAGWMILTKRVALGFVALAIINEIVWRTMSNDTWVIVETFGFPIMLAVYLTANIMALDKYLIEEDTDKAKD
ncbi:MAG: inner membrane-spanning protein YciB [Planktomarina sp.]